MRARPIGVLALAALAAALQSDVADAAIPPGIFYFCTDCGANSTMALQCNGTDLFGDGNYKGDGKFTLAVSIAGIPIMKFRGPSMCGQDTKVLLPGAAGALLVHGLDDCTGKKRLHWSGIDALVEAPALSGWREANVHLETESDHLLCVDVVVKRIPVGGIDDDFDADDDVLKRRRRQRIARAGGGNKDKIQMKTAENT